jgi:hypothetical protein
VQVPLADRGQSPDVAASDGIWSGSTLFGADDAIASLSVGGAVYTAEKVAWDKDNFQRDITLRLDAGVLTAATNGSGGVGGDFPAVDGGTTATGSAGAGAADGSASTASAAGSWLQSDGASGPMAPGEFGASTGSKSSGDYQLYLGLAAGVVALAALGYFALRNRDDDGGDFIQPLPEPPLVGPGTPSLSDGLSLWVHNADDAEGLLGALLATLARHHRVLVVGEEEFVVPRVFGGPVYRCPGIEPDEVGEAAEDLVNEGGTPLTLLVCLDAVRAHALLEELPEGLGGVALVSDPGEVVLPTVRCAREGGLWVLTTAGGTAIAKVGSGGFELVEARA